MKTSKQLWTRCIEFGTKKIICNFYVNYQWCSSWRKYLRHFNDLNFVKFISYHCCATNCNGGLKHINFLHVFFIFRNLLEICIIFLIGFFCSIIEHSHVETNLFHQFYRVQAKRYLFNEILKYILIFVQHDTHWNWIFIISYIM